MTISRTERSDNIWIPLDDYVGPVGTVLGGALLVYVLIRLVRLIRNDGRRRRWTPVTATVSDVDIRYVAGEPRSFIEYEYAIDGRQYSGAARYHSEPLPHEGLEIPVHVHPSEPEHSVFDDHGGGNAYRIGLVVATAFAALVFCLCLAQLLR